MARTSEYAIKVENVYKSFRLPSQRRNTLIEFLSNPRSLVDGNKFHVLNGVSFDVKHGESVGIIGDNGSGKSTMLKILAGIYRPDRGKVSVHGKMVPFLELGVGFHPELTARENIFLNGVILGMSKEFLKEKFDEIVEFAELEKFLDLPLKNFSSGMQVRLAFSIAFKSNADIYVLDEVFAVGDIHFQKKCYDVFKDLKNDKKTLILVSHSMDMVKDFCDRVVLLNKGELYTDGTPEEVIKHYKLTVN